MSSTILIMWIVLLFLLPAVLSLFLQKFDFLNNILNKTIIFYLSLGLSAFVLWYTFYNERGSVTYQHFNSSLFTTLFILIIYVLCAYLVNALLSKFNFSLKNKTLKSTLSSSIFLMTITFTTIGSNS